MVYIGVAPENESNFLFMRSPNNVLFTSAHVLFNEVCFPCCVKPTCMQPTALVTPPITGEHEPIRPLLPADNDDYRPRSPVAYPPSPSPIPPHTPSPCLAMPMPPAPTCPQCECHVLHWPGNVYGDDQHLVKQVKEIECRSCWCDNIRKPGLSNRLKPQMPGNLPGTPIAPPAHTPTPSTASDSKDYIKWLCHEGGAELAAFLMSKAIPIQAISAETKPIHKWTYRNILKLPAAAQEEWKATCQHKLDILYKCHIPFICPSHLWPSDPTPYSQDMNSGAFSLRTLLQISRSPSCSFFSLSILIYLYPY